MFQIFQQVPKRWRRKYCWWVKVDRVKRACVRLYSLITSHEIREDWVLQVRKVFRFIVLDLIHFGTCSNCWSKIYSCFFICFSGSWTRARSIFGQFGVEYLGLWRSRVVHGELFHFSTRPNLSKRRGAHLRLRCWKPRSRKGLSILSIVFGSFVAALAWSESILPNTQDGSCSWRSSRPGYLRVRSLYFYLCLIEFLIFRFSPVEKKIWKSSPSLWSVHVFVPQFGTKPYTK